MPVYIQYDLLEQWFIEKHLEPIRETAPSVTGLTSQINHSLLYLDRCVWRVTLTNIPTGYRI